jgi:hypothetical protein
MAKRKQKQKVDFPRGKNPARMAELQAGISEQRKNIQDASVEERQEYIEALRSNVETLQKIAQSPKEHAKSAFTGYSKREMQASARMTAELLVEVESQPNVSVSKDAEKPKETALSERQLRRKDWYDSSTAHLKDQSLEGIQEELAYVEEAISNPPDRRNAIYFSYDDIERDLLFKFRDQLKALLADSDVDSKADVEILKTDISVDEPAVDLTSVQDVPAKSNIDLMNQTIDSIREGFFWDEATDDEQIADIQELKDQIADMESLEGGDKSGHMYASLSEDEWSDMLRMKKELLSEFETSIAQSSPEPEPEPDLDDSPLPPPDLMDSPPEPPVSDLDDSLRPPPTHPKDPQPPQKPDQQDSMPSPEKVSPQSGDLTKKDLPNLLPPDALRAPDNVLNYPDGKKVDTGAIDPSAEKDAPEVKLGLENPMAEEKEVSVPKSRMQRVKESAGNFWKKHFRGDVLPEEEVSEQKEMSKADIARSVSYGLLSGAASLTGVKAIPDIVRYMSQRHFTSKERARLMAEFNKMDLQPEAEAAADVSAVHSRADEIKQLIESSKHLTAAKRAEMTERMTKIVSNYDGQIGLTMDRRNKKIAELINQTIETRIKGTTVVKETVNAAMMASWATGAGLGIQGLRSMTYGGASLYERWQQVSKERSSGEREGGQLKEMFVNGFTETWSNLGGGGAETKLGKAANMAKAWGTVTRAAGFTYLAAEFSPEGIDMLLDKMSEGSDADLADVVANQDKLESTFETPAQELNLGTVEKGDGIVAIMKRQIEAQPELFGYTGDVNDTDAVASWANTEAISKAKDVGIIRDVGEMRLKTEAIGNVSIVFKENAAGDLVPYVLDAKTGEDFDTSEMDKYFYGHEYQPGPAAAPGAVVEAASVETPVSSESSDVYADAIAATDRLEGDYKDAGFKISGSEQVSEGIATEGRVAASEVAATATQGVEAAAEVPAVSVQEYQVPGFKGKFHFERGPGGQIEGIDTEDMISQFRARDNREALDMVKDARGPTGVSDWGRKVYPLRKEIGQELHALIKIEDAMDGNKDFRGSDEIKAVRKAIVDLVNSSNEDHGDVLRIQMSDRRIRSALS